MDIYIMLIVFGIVGIWGLVGVWVFNFSKGMPYWLYCVLRHQGYSGGFTSWVKNVWDPRECSDRVNREICSKYFGYMGRERRCDMIVELDGMGKIVWDDYGVFTYGSAAIKAGIGWKLPSDSLFTKSMVLSIRSEDIEGILSHFHVRVWDKIAFFYPFTVEVLSRVLSNVPEFGSRYRLVNIRDENAGDVELFRYVSDLIERIDTKIPDEAIRLADDLWLLDGRLYSGRK